MQTINVVGSGPSMLYLLSFAFLLMNYRNLNYFLNFVSFIVLSIVLIKIMKLLKYHCSVFSDILFSMDPLS